MATALFNLADICPVDFFPNPQLLKPDMVFRRPNDVHTGSKIEVGTLQFRSLLFAEMHVMNLHWQVGRDVSITESSPADTVNINFQMSGHMDTRFTGIAREVTMKPQRHNLVFSPEGGFRNTVKAGQQIEMFHISINKRYFCDLIGCDDHWSERAQNELLADRPFAGKAESLQMTPYMHRLIGDIKQCPEAGGMRNLLIQSKVLELLALQMGQLQWDRSDAQSLTAADIERLQELKAFLDTNFLEDFTLPQLARRCLLNEFKLKRGFKQLFGTTVFAYIRKHRMDFATKLLRDSSKSIAEISEALGFQHSQHFSTAFKRHFGLNPSDCRQTGFGLSRKK